MQSIQNVVARKLLLVGFPAALGLAVCACASETDSEDIAQAPQAFVSWNNANEHLISRAFSGVTVCLQGTNVTNATRPGFQDSIRRAIRAWFAGARGAATRQFNNTVTFSCVGQNVTINWDAAQGRAQANWDAGAFRSVDLFSNSTYTTVLHEFGHVFGIGDTYIEGVWSCHPGQENSVMCGSGGIPDVLQPDDNTAIQEVYCAAFPNDCNRRWSFPQRLCGQNGGVIYVGDFNGDGRDDLLCHDKADGMWFTALATANGTFQDTSGWHDDWLCTEPQASLFVGDFNGDGSDDMLCHDRADGRGWTMPSNGDGTFGELNGWWNETLCTEPQASLYIGDFNGDGSDDMLCHDRADGRGWTMPSNGDGTFGELNGWWEGRWCSEEKARFHIGDFNGDGSDDLLCYDKTDGRWLTMMANGNGTFAPGGWSPAAICAVRDDIEIHVGDFNGNGRDDMLCHNKADGTELIAFAEANGSFPGTSRSWRSSWCNGAGETLSIGKFNSNSAADLLCQDSAKSAKSIMYQAP
jgi:hypothetical protein